MPASSYRLEDLIPHRPPMVLLDEIVSCDLASDTPTLVAATTVRPDWSGNESAVEYMAQAAAALAGASDRARDPSAPPRPGFLLGTRRLVLHGDGIVAGARLLVTAANVYFDGGAASFACTIADASGHPLAEATLNAYRPSAGDGFQFDRSSIV